MLSNLLMTAQLLCAPLGEIHEAITKDFQEKVLVTLQAADGTERRIYVGEKSWNVILVKGPTGCLLDNGEGKITYGQPGKDS